MSYILDALKNSDKERKKGSVPDLQSQPDRLLPPAPIAARAVRRSPLLWISLLLLAAVVAWLLTRPVATDPGQPSPPPTVADPQIGRPVEVAPMAEAEEPRQPPLPVDADYLDELKDVQLDVAPIIEEEALEPPAPETGTADPPVAMSEELPAETAPLPEPAPIVSAADQPSEQTTPAAAPDPYAGILHQHQLPSDVQRELPELDITVHIYSATPSSRLVRINSRTYQEGDLVDGQVRLEEITPDGLILSFGDNRYWRYVN